MDTEAGMQHKLQAELAELRDRFPVTQDLYREVCVLLFFRHGITPTANKLYQLVHKGSMSAPAEALAKFWSDLREKSRVRLDHPNLPEDLKTAAGDLVGTLWSKAQGLAQESLAASRAEAQAIVLEAKAGQTQAEATRDASLDDLRTTVIARDAALARIRDIEQVLAGEVATRAGLEVQLADARQTVVDLKGALDAARRDFGAELEKLRNALNITEERYQAAEARALLEIDRERTLAAKLQREVEAVRAAATEALARHQVETRLLQQNLGDQKQRIGRLEGELKAVCDSRDQLLADLTGERESSRDLSSRLSSAAHDAELWQQKTIAAHQELESLRAARQRKARKGTEHQDLTKRGPE